MTKSDADVKFVYSDEVLSITIVPPCRGKQKKSTSMSCMELLLLSGVQARLPLKGNIYFFRYKKPIHLI